MKPADYSPITSLTIRFFKSIVEQSVQLGSINVFIGANGSGKSNALEALGVLSAAAAGRVDDEALKRRGVRPGVPRLYKNAFRDGHLPPNISFEVQTIDASYSVSLNNPLEAPRPAWLYKTEELKSRDIVITSRGPRTGKKYEIAKNKEQGLAALEIVKIEQDDPAVRLIDLLRDYAIYAPNTLMLRGLETDSQTREPVGLSGGRLPDAVRELKSLAQSNEFIESALNDLIEIIGWIEDFDATGLAESLLSASVARPRTVLRFTDKYMREGKNTLSAYDSSEGALYALFCAVLALLPKGPRCFAVDNLDQALNPRLAQRLISLICKWITDNPFPRQMLFTAHNPSVLDGLPLQDKRVKLFAVDRDSQGHTLIKEVTITNKLIEMNKKGWTLSRLWVMGHIGGVPNV